MAELDTIALLDRAREIWNDPSLSLYDKVVGISEQYYSASFDLSATAAHLGMTPTELDSLLALSELDEEMLVKISDANPPTTAWMLFANANDDEIVAALGAIHPKGVSEENKDVDTVGERLWSAMIQVSGPTVEQQLATIDPTILGAMARRAEEFKALVPKALKAIKSFAAQRRRGKVLSEKQVDWLRSMLEEMADNGVIVRDGIDKDHDACNAALDIIGR